jgi:hypothetical protein
MRIRNREIRARRHRKDQVVKAAQKVIRAQFADKKAATPAKPKAPAPKKATSKPAAKR